MIDFVKTSKQSENNLTKEEMTALIGLSKDKSIIVSKADKGNTIVIQNSSDYIDKIVKILEDKSKFECIENDLTLEREQKLSQYLKNLLDQKKIDEKTDNQIRPVSSRPGVLNGLLKVHKKDVPIRPIISSIDTYNYNLA